MEIRRGVTRTVIVGRRWAVKLPIGLGMSFHGLAGDLVRGWLANQSEWRQRRRPGVARPRLTLLHLVLVMPAADWVGSDRFSVKGPWQSIDPADVGARDEAKPSSWGRFGDRWLLIDFDRAWERDGRGLVGRLYYGHQERSARRWARLPSA